MDVHVLFRFSKKTGKIDTTMTGITTALMQMWALQNTTKTKDTMIINQKTGAVIFYAHGTGDFPKVEKENLGTCDQYGIPLEVVQEIRDERF